MQDEDNLFLDDGKCSIFDLVEADRRRIAANLHDTSLQNLAHLVHKIELAQLMIDQDPLKAKLELAVINKNLRNVIDDIRNTIFDLRPMTFDDLGLKAAFERLLTVLNENKEYEIDADIQDVSCENNKILMNIYRAVQECLTNISKHSAASKIIFRCYRENDVCHISIEDNGNGFDISSFEKEKHFGISLLRERIHLLGGTITIQSEISKGVNINIEIPLI